MMFSQNVRADARVGVLSARASSARLSAVVLGLWISAFGAVLFFSPYFAFAADTTASSTPSGDATSTPAVTSITSTTTVATSSSATTTPLGSNANVEATLRAYFKDAPVMVAIARCESGLRQFGPDGKPLHGGVGMGMVGAFQIYESVHTNAALALGFDLKTLAGNMGYAKHLYDTLGTSSWNSDRSCWMSAPEYQAQLALQSSSATSSTTTPLTSTPQTPGTTDTKALEAKIAILVKLVSLLQQVIELQHQLAALK